MKLIHLAFALTALLISASSYGQVIIESGPNGVGFSNRDGRTQLPASTGYYESVSSRRVPVAPVNTSIRSSSSSRGITSSQSTRPILVPPPVVVRQTPAFRPVTQVIDVQKIQRQARLERELEVIKTNKMAWMAFDPNLLFNSKQGTLKATARPLLDKVLAYMAISGGKGIAIAYEFKPGQDSQGLSDARTNAITNYLISKSGMSIGNFHVCESKPLAPRAFQYGQYSTVQAPAPKSVVNIRIQR